MQLHLDHPGERSCRGDPRTDTRALARAFIDAASVPLSCSYRRRARRLGLRAPTPPSQTRRAAVQRRDRRRPRRRRVARRRPVATPVRGRAHQRQPRRCRRRPRARRLARPVHVDRRCLCGRDDLRRHVQALRDLDTKRTRAALRHAQGYLTDAARDCSWADFVDICHRWIANADPDGELADEKVREPGLTIKTNADGTISGSFRFDPLTGTAVKNAIERGAAAAHRRRPDHYRGSPTQPPPTPGRCCGIVDHEGRTPARRHHRCATPPRRGRPRDPRRSDGARRCQRAWRCRVRCRREATRRRSAHRPGRPAPAVRDGRRHARASQARAGDAGHRVTLRRLVLGADGEILDLGRSVKTFPKHLKEAMMAAAAADAPTAAATPHRVGWKGITSFPGHTTATPPPATVRCSAARATAPRVTASSTREIQTTPTRADLSATRATTDGPISEAA